MSSLDLVYSAPDLTGATVLGFFAIVCLVLYLEERVSSAVRFRPIWHANSALRSERERKRPSRDLESLDDGLWSGLELHGAGVEAKRANGCVLVFGLGCSGHGASVDDGSVLIRCMVQVGR